MHHPLQIRYPEWSTRFCVDPVKARQTRTAFLKEHADTGRLIFPAHFPTPTGGRSSVTAPITGSFSTASAEPDLGGAAARSLQLF